MNEEAIEYWEAHGTVPSPESQAALLAQVEALQAQVRALEAKPVRRRTVPPKREEAASSYETVAINAAAMETTRRLMALPALSGLDRTMVYQVVEAHQRGLSSRKIRETLRWGTGKYNDVIRPVVAALATVPAPTNKTAPAKNTVATTRQRIAATH